MSQRYEKHIFVTKELKKRADEILGSDGPIEGFPSIHTFETSSAEFPNGIEVDVKVCNGDTPYVDVVWFQNGNEIGTDEPSDELIGESSLEWEGVEYVLHVKELGEDLWVIPNPEDTVIIPEDDLFRRQIRMPLDQEGWVIVEGNVYPLVGEEFVEVTPTGQRGLYPSGGFLSGDELKRVVPLMMQVADKEGMGEEAKARIGEVAEHLDLAR